MPTAQAAQAAAGPVRRLVSAPEGGRCPRGDGIGEQADDDNVVDAEFKEVKKG